MERDAVRRFAEGGDAESFRLLVEEFHPRVLRLISSILGPWSDLDAEGVAQDVFLQIYRKARQFRGDAAGASWIYRIAYTHALSLRRRARIRFPHESEAALVSATADAADPLETLATARRRVEVWRAIEELPDLYRTIVHSHYWLEMSVKEIAEALVVPEGTVKSYLSRARARLRALLGESHRGGFS